MIIHVQISIDSRPYNADLSACESAEVEIAPVFLPCLNIGKLAEKLAARAFGEYLARRGEVNEQEEAE